MPAVLDQSIVFGEFNSSIPDDISAPLRPHIAGPEAILHRYSVAAEKAAASLGEYDPDAEQTYDYPDRQVGSIVNQSSVHVYIDDALLQYFEDLKSVGSTVTPVASYLNRVKYNNANGLKTNGSSYPRLAALKDRDVQVGDVVYLADGSDTLTTTVADLIADPVAASVDAATSDAANDIAQPNSTPGSAPTYSATGGGSSGGNLQAGDYYIRYSFVGTFGETWASDASTQMTVSAGNIPRVTIPALPTGATSARIYLSPTNGTAVQATLYKSGVTTTTTDLTDAYASGGAAYPKRVTQTSGTVNDVEVTTASSSAYNGSATGDIVETYTIVVQEAPGTPGDATTAVLSVTSASGRDDQASVTPAAYGSATSIGTRGLTITWDNTSDDFEVGQTWHVTVRQLWAVPVPTSGGSYTGTTSLSYIVRVTRGGLYADSIKPQITVISDNGADSSGPTNVTAAASAVSIGTKSATIQFSGTGLSKDDIYYVPVTGPSDGAFKTILLANNLTTALQASSDMSITLYLKKDIVVPLARVSSPGDTNYTVGADTITIADGIDAYDDSLTDADVAFSCPVKGGTVYVDYSEWVDDHSGRITEVSTEADVETAFGITWTNIHPDHVLAYGVKRAVQNSNGTVVKFSGVADPDDLTAWEDVLDMLSGYNDVFTLVPLSRDPDVITAYQTHILERSDDDIGGEWRHGWFNLAATGSVAIVDATTTSDDEVALAAVADNPAVSGTQYTYLSVAAGNANFVTNGVQVGDIVRFQYSVDAYGDETYNSYVVAQVVNEDTLVLATGTLTAVSTPQKVEVWRTLSKNQVAQNLAAQITGANIDTRFVFLWPDEVTDEDGLVVTGYHLCAAYAGFIGGVAPHQGLRNVQVSGFLSTPRSTTYFNNGQLNTLAAAGFFIVTTAPDGKVYARTARTADMTSVATREEAVARLDDAIRYLFWNKVADFHGKSNLTDSAISLITVELQSSIQHGVSDTRIERIGSMIVSGAITSPPRQHVSIEDRLVVEMSVVRPFVLNDTTLLVSF